MAAPRYGLHHPRPASARDPRANRRVHLVLAVGHGAARAESAAEAAPEVESSAPEPSNAGASNAKRAGCVCVATRSRSAGWIALFVGLFGLLRATRARIASRGTETHGARSGSRAAMPDLASTHPDFDVGPRLARPMLSREA